MANFDTSLKKTLANEGGFFINKITGEVVNRGITVRFLRSIGKLRGEGAANEYETEYVRSMTKEQTTELYREYFWDRNHLGDIDDQQLADKVFDLCVNMGPGNAQVDGAITMLQHAVNELRCATIVTVDGKMGLTTTLAVNQTAAEALYSKYIAMAEARYRRIAQNPVQVGNLPGWLARLHKA